MRISLKACTFLLLCSVLYLGSCTDDTVDPGEVTDVNCDAENFVYNNDLSALIETKCQGCHVTGGQSFPLTNYAELKVYLDNGLFDIEVFSDASRMDDWGNLTAEEVAQLQCWYDDGYPEN